MTLRRAACAVLAAGCLTLPLGGLIGCGGRGGDGATSPQAAAAAAGQAYAARVAAVTQQASARLAQLASSSSYETASAAQASTQAYAATISAAADGLAKAGPPAPVTAQHQALVELYRSTATRMQALATTFGATTSVAELSRRAQAFTAEVQRYTARESQLRGAIEQVLAAQVAPPAVGATTGSGIQGTSDPG